MNDYIHTLTIIQYVSHQKNLGHRQIESLDLWLRAVRGEKIEEELDGDGLVQKIRSKMGEG